MNEVTFGNLRMSWLINVVNISTQLKFHCLYLPHEYHRIQVPLSSVLPPPYPQTSSPHCLGEWGHPKAALTNFSAIDRACFTWTSNQTETSRHWGEVKYIPQTLMFPLECLNVKVQGQKPLNQVCHSRILRSLSRGLEKKLKFSGKPPVFQQKPQDSKNF